MSLKTSKILQCLMMLCFVSNMVCGASQECYKRIVRESNESPVIYACLDLQRYLGQVLGVVPESDYTFKWDPNQQPSIVIASLATLNKCLPSTERVKSLGGEGFAIKMVTIGTRQSILLCGETPIGQMHAVYGLLKELGFEFRMGSEYIPPCLPDTFTDKLIVRKPVFAVRGVLPWYNFFNSPTSWEPIDHRAFVDQLVRSGANFITFHTYDNEPFFGVNDNGQMVYSEGLNNSGKPTWGTNPMQTQEFMFGTDKFFDNQYFGAQTTLSGVDRNTQIIQEKQILRDALNYAKSRGIITSLGFEAVGDPTFAPDRDKFIKKLTANVEYYKTLDYLFIWQPESQGAQGFSLTSKGHLMPSHRSPESKMSDYGEYRRELFSRVVETTKGEPSVFSDDESGRVSRAIEGARLELFARLALRVLSRYERAPKIVIAGWGGQERLLSQEYYEGLDKVLPKDVAFSSLDNIIPRTYVDDIYGELPADRQRWAIPWLEWDGDQWHPQPYINAYQPMIKTLKEGGSQGFLNIHWRTREVEDNFGFMSDYAWNPLLTKQSYFEQKAAKYGSSAETVKQVYIDLEDLGYRWVNGGGQSECMNFSWGSGSVQNMQKLKRIGCTLDSLLNVISANRENILWMRNRIDWVINYQYAEIAAETAKDLLMQAQAAEPVQREVFAKRAYAILSNDLLARAMQSYARRITTRGEYGVLATINTKAAWNWRKMYRQSAQIIGADTTYKNNLWSAHTEIIIPRFYGSCAQGQQLDVEVIVTDDSPVTLKYRNVGDLIWKHKPMTTTSGWVRRATIPANELSLPAIEFKIAVKDIESEAKTVTINTETVIENSINLKSEQLDDMGRIEMKRVKNMNLIEWNDSSSADYYAVYINGVLQLESPINFYPYPESIRSKLVEVKAMRDGKVLMTVKKQF